MLVIKILKMHFNGEQTFHRCTRVLADRFITDGDKEWFDVELVNTLEKELGEDAGEIIKEPKYFVDFMRDAPEPTGEEV